MVAIRGSAVASTMTATIGAINPTYTRYMHELTIDTIDTRLTLINITANSVERKFSW